MSIIKDLKARYAVLAGIKSRWYFIAGLVVASMLGKIVSVFAAILALVIAYLFSQKEES